MYQSNGSVATIKDAHIAHFNIKINGAQLPVEPMNDLIECVVENSLHLPDMCTIRIEDHQFRWLDSSHFEEGNSVVIEGGEGKGALTPIFHGEVVSLEMDLAAHGIATIIVRCLDRSHRLHRGREARSFVNVTDTDIVKKVGRELGFTVVADATSQVHDWVLQNNQTNWEFLTERAARNGFRLYLQGEKKLYFKKVQDKGDDKLKIEWGKELRSFRPRTSAATQVDEVIVKGWDPKTKSAIEGKSKAPRGIPNTARNADGGKLAKKAFGPAKMTVVDRPVHSTAEAEALAQSIRDEIAGSFLEADGLCFALPKLKPGMTVEIPNIGKRFSGEYYVTTTTHTYTPSEGYATQFAVSGKSAPTLLASLGGGHTKGTKSPVGGNIVVGIVTDNKDPEGLGRVKVKYPWLTDQHTSFWARQSSQMAGKGRGMFNIPEIEDEVLVAFEHGDISRPFLLGQLWNGKDKPPAPKGNAMHGPGSVTNRRGFYSRIGHQIHLDDTGGKGDVTIITAGGHKITADDAAKNVAITTTGNHKVDINDMTKSISVESTGGHKVRVDDLAKTISIMTTGGQKVIMTDMGNVITMTDTAGDTVMMSNGMINISAMQMMNLTAPVINIAAPIAVNITALQTTMAAGALATVSGGAATQITGGMAVTVTGAVIKLNC